MTNFAEESARPADCTAGKAELAASYAYCRTVARTSARNFYYSFVTLPRARKDAMCAIYAFMRRSDDAADEPGDFALRERRMRAWRATVDAALQGNYGSEPVLPALHHTICRFRVPVHYLYEVMEGTSQDLSAVRFETFEELRAYCYRVAGVVGFVCLYVWGFGGDRAEVMRMGEACGLAFQLTNILRDVAEDGARGNIYLPQEDLRRFGVTDAMLLNASAGDKAVRELLRFEAERAEDWYRAAEPLAACISTPSRPTFEIMFDIYHAILTEIKRLDYDVFSDRITVSTPRKVMAVARAVARTRFSALRRRR
ncbi:MAG: squalene/phytoene synthase family protein [Armatimonadetes bacterium]|nr:squalene/phytoene synthase family protein [Armatimonadota bacterium]MDE2207656.1 squalene/phytoene synthase family protein [Armatimonadota bacterium]